PDNSEAIYLLGIAAHQQDRHDRAIQLPPKPFGSFGSLPAASHPLCPVGQARRRWRQGRRWWRGQGGGGGEGRAGGGGGGGAGVAEAEGAEVARVAGAEAAEVAAPSGMPTAEWGSPSSCCRRGIVGGGGCTCLVPGSEDTPA